MRQSYREVIRPSINVVERFIRPETKPQQVGQGFDWIAISV